MAWAAYGYFHFTNKSFHEDSPTRKNETIALVDILNIEYKDYGVAQTIQLGQSTKQIIIGTLDGDFTPNQAKRFFKKYDLLIHQPNTEKGFSVGLFEELIC
ncbi:MULTISPECIES: hypothetical protein [unclassified Helicobacter]|uniref:hypothetical protein n=1 Tax=unclassified Helicobacter TaxID=2593540 RepID=UPI001F383532|nr:MULTISPECIES: hypothetical protein [unclassified Helicobacter]